MRFKLPPKGSAYPPGGAVYSVKKGAIRYLNGQGLSKPLTMERPQIIMLGIFVVLALAIGFSIIMNLVEGIHSSASSKHTSVEENLSKNIDYDFPSLPALAPLDDDGIRRAFKNQGLTTYEKPSDKNSKTEPLQIIKLPPGVSVSDAALMYAGGINKLDAAKAALLLNGSWTLTADNGTTRSLHLRYADFKSGSVGAAIEAAIKSEGFDPSTTPAEGGSGIDAAGNTFQTGTISIDGTDQTWRVSAIGLSSAFDIKGLPDSAVYVGIRLST